jgi:hypothetical protein
MKTRLLEALESAKGQLKIAQEVESATQEASDSMDRTYWEGQVDALSFVAQLLEEAGK